MSLPNTTSSTSLMFLCLGLCTNPSLYGWAAITFAGKMSDCGLRGGWYCFSRSNMESRDVDCCTWSPAPGCSRVCTGWERPWTTAAMSADGEPSLKGTTSGSFGRRGGGCVLSRPPAPGDEPSSMFIATSRIWSDEGSMRPRSSMSWELSCKDIAEAVSTYGMSSVFILGRYGGT